MNLVLELSQQQHVVQSVIGLGWPPQMCYLASVAPSCLALPHEHVQRVHGVFSLRMLRELGGFISGPLNLGVVLECACSCNKD